MAANAAIEFFMAVPHSDSPHCTANV
jgi:hypothetical protein